MRKEIISSNASSSRMKIDPRTKLMLIFTISTVLIAGESGGAMSIIKPALALVPFILLIVNKHLESAIKYIFIYALAFLAEMVFIPSTTGIVNFLLVGTAGIFSRMLPGFMMGYVLFSTTKVSEFISAMEKMHVTEKITIPMSVMFRFFPTVYEEGEAIGDAMRMRGIGMGSLFKSPLKMLEYRMVPLLMSSVKIGEELSAASLTRGLGGKDKRTNICDIGFGLWDIIFLIVCVIGWVGFIVH
ncbi:MAG: energy-coupling factor transporter transmembrane protein EcfT [Clostridium sp.]|nr:energy-coupling factor transporter transmembrane protein EcfT [Clostridium sp.]